LGIRKRQTGRGGALLVSLCGRTSLIAVKFLEKRKEDGSGRKNLSKKMSEKKNEREPHMQCNAFLHPSIHPFSLSISPSTRVFVSYQWRSRLVRRQSRDMHGEGLTDDGH